MVVIYSGGIDILVHAPGGVGDLAGGRPIAGDLVGEGQDHVVVFNLAPRLDGPGAQEDEGKRCECRERPSLENKVRSTVHDLLYPLRNVSRSGPPALWSRGRIP